mmetsp:Transcript_12746/g.53592  ORF Transcript_12746/g.53592 Transcript_12746/m.53592 type:complete len:235 (-) Transcript_12746:240-944(-)
MRTVRGNPTWTVWAARPPTATTNPMPRLRLRRQRHRCRSRCMRRTTRTPHKSPLTSSSLPPLPSMRWCRRTRIQRSLPAPQAMGSSVAATHDTASMIASQTRARSHRIRSMPWGTSRSRSMMTKTVRRIQRIEPTLTTATMPWILTTSPCRAHMAKAEHRSRLCTRPPSMRPHHACIRCRAPLVGRTDRGTALPRRRLHMSLLTPRQRAWSELRAPKRCTHRPTIPEGCCRSAR